MATPSPPFAPNGNADGGASQSGRASKGAPLFLADDALFDEHRPRGYHPERPERLTAARRAVARVQQTLAGRESDPKPERAVATESLAPRDATHEELVEAHDAGYVEALMSLSGREARIDADTYVSPRSVDAARRAAGLSIALVEAVLNSEGPSKGFAVVRPPGHHATRESGMGFCLFNNAALAAYAALRRGLKRVAIVDWDVHHGNGTQDIFYADPRVMYVSLHQFPFYPGTGAVTETGEGDAVGYTVNVPLAGGASDAVYLKAFEEIVAPALSELAPELIIVSAGYDAHERDPLASMRLSSAAYGQMTRSLMSVADRTAGGKLAVLLEGGYDLAALEGSVSATLDALIGTPAPEPSLSPQRLEVSPGHRHELDDARQALKRHWKNA